MKIGILGTGDVGKALDKGFIALGHEVKMGSRSATNPAALAWAREMGGKASAGTFADATAFGELIALAVKGEAIAEVIKAAGPKNFKGKVVIDVTNPLDFSGPVPRLKVAGYNSGGEQVQGLLPDAHVVKAFNTVGHLHFFKPDFPGGPPTMFYCGNNDDAKKKVAGILKDFGWEILDVGGIESAHYLEAMCMIWVIHAMRANSYGHAFKLLRK